MHKIPENSFFHIGRIKDGDVDKNTIRCDLTKAEAIEFCKHNQLGTYKVAYSVQNSKNMVDYNNRTSEFFITYDEKDIFILEYVVEISFNCSKNDFEYEDSFCSLTWPEPKH